MFIFLMKSVDVIETLSAGGNISSVPKAFVQPSDWLCKELQLEDALLSFNR